ncbi:MAG: hypothetical protein AABM29_10380 [Actinomycetota bacterium]
MQLILANRRLDAIGGSETYLLTVADHLQRLGHDVTLFGLETGATARVAEARGLQVQTQADRLPSRADATICQDSEVAYTLSVRYPDAARLFVAHSVCFEIQSPPQVPGAVNAVVVLNDRVRRHCEAMAHTPEVARLRQPVDPLRFAFAAGPDGLRQRRVLALSNNLAGARLAMLAQACRRLGLELDLVGRHGRISESPEHEIGRADIVVGAGRCVIEAMAAGKPAYVYDIDGGDGWVDPQSYAALEANGFAGTATDDAIDTDRLERDLAAVDPATGEANRDLARRHHDAERHAVELAKLLERTTPAPPPPATVLAELARLARAQRRAEEWAMATSGENHRLLRQIDRITSGGSYRLARAIGRPVAWLRRR